MQNGGGVGRGRAVRVQAPGVRDGGAVQRGIADLAASNGGERHVEREGRLPLAARQREPDRVGAEKRLRRAVRRHGACRRRDVEGKIAALGRGDGIPRTRAEMVGVCHRNERNAVFCGELLRLGGGLPPGELAETVLRVEPRQAQQPVRCNAPALGKDDAVG